MVSVNIASSIGAFATFAEIVFSAIVGFILLANMRITLMQNLNALMQRQISVHAFQKLNLWSIFIYFARLFRRYCRFMSAI